VDLTEREQAYKTYSTGCAKNCHRLLKKFNTKLRCQYRPFKLLKGLKKTTKEEVIETAFLPNKIYRQLAAQV
jgi:hypothetical protein